MESTDGRGGGIGTEGGGDGGGEGTDEGTGDEWEARHFLSVVELAEASWRWRTTRVLASAALAGDEGSWTHR